MIRINSGYLKGRVIELPDAIRPTKSKVREAVFDILYGIYPIEDSIVLDAFGGSGAFGFEALSLGAKFVYFCEKSKEVLKTLYRNTLAIKDDSTLCSKFKETPIFIHKGDMLRFCPNTNIDIAFMDPPYQDDIDNYVHHIRKFLKNILIIETDARKAPKELEGFSLIKSKIYGHSSLSFWEPSNKIT